jgi:hypothetical protein
LGVVCLGVVVPEQDLSILTSASGSCDGRPSIEAGGLFIGHTNVALSNVA